MCERHNIRHMFGIEIFLRFTDAIYYSVKGEEVTPLYTPRPGLLRYKGYIWRGNKQIDIVKRFYGTRSPMHGPRLRPSLNGPSLPRVGTHSNWFPDRSSFRGRFKLANRSRLTSDLSDYPILYATACQIFMIVFPIKSLGGRRGDEETVMHGSLVIECVLFGVAPI